MAFTGLGQILSSRMATRVEQSVNIYNAKIADIQMRIDNLRRYRSVIPGYLSQAEAMAASVRSQIEREGVFTL